MNENLIEIDDILNVEKHIDGLETVIFDLDDTLYSEKEYVWSGYKKIAEKFCEAEIEDELWSAFLKHEPAIDVVLEKHGLSDRKAEVLSIYRNQNPDIHLYPGVAEMLERIAQDLKIAIVTDGRPEGQRAKIRALGLENIPFIITDDLGGMEYRKPCDRAFKLMLKELNTPPEHAAYIGDNIHKDFIAPEKLGMRCIWFKNKDGLYYVR